MQMRRPSRMPGWWSSNGRRITGTGCDMDPAYRGAIEAARRDGEQALEIVEEIGLALGPQSRPLAAWLRCAFGGRRCGGAPSARATHRAGCVDRSGRADGGAVRTG